MTAHTSKSRTGSSVARSIARIGLGTALAGAGVTHLTVARKDFQAQVPEWVPLDKDFVVLASGVVEIALGAALVALPKQQKAVGRLTAGFFTAIFPGNVSQYVTKTSAFGLDTDAKRLARLPFQAVLIGWALWSTTRPPRH